jgi:hypothetical protein
MAESSQNNVGKLRSIIAVQVKYPYVLKNCESGLVGPSKRFKSWKATEARLVTIYHIFRMSDRKASRIQLKAFVLNISSL